MKKIKKSFFERDLELMDSRKVESIETTISKGKIERKIIKK